MLRLTSSPLRAAFFCLLSLILAACALGSTDTRGAPTAAPIPTDAPPTIATQTEIAPSVLPTPTTEAPPTPTATPLIVGLVGHFADAPAGSIAALITSGMQTAATTNSSLYTLAVVDIDANNSADPQVAIQTAVGQGATVVVVAGAELSEAATTAAGANPAVKFVLVDESNPSGATTLQNLFVVGGAGNRADQAGFLAGALAGYTTKTRTVGLVIIANTLEGKLYNNGFQSGLRYTCGDCKFWPIELADATDREIGKGTAARLQNVQVDVMTAFAGEAGEAGLAEGAAQGLWVIGGGRDYGQTLSVGKERVLSGILYRPDILLPNFINQLLTGNPSTTSLPFTLSNGAITFSPTLGPDVSPAVADLMTSLIEQLASGALDTGVDPATGEVQ